MYWHSTWFLISVCYFFFAFRFACFNYFISIKISVLKVTYDHCQIKVMKTCWGAITNIGCY